MKANEPPPRLVKYGLPASETHHIVERHFAVLREESAIDAFLFDHELRVGRQVQATATGIAPVPVAPPVTEAAPALSIAPPTVVITERAKPDNLRERLGLT